MTYDGELNVVLLAMHGEFSKSGHCYSGHWPINTNLDSTTGDNVASATANKARGYFAFARVTAFTTKTAPLTANQQSLPQCI